MCFSFHFVASPRLLVTESHEKVSLQKGYEDIKLKNSQKLLLNYIFNCVCILKIEFLC